MLAGFQVRGSGGTGPEKASYDPKGSECGEAIFTAPAWLPGVWGSKSSAGAVRGQYEAAHAALAAMRAGLAKLRVETQHRLCDLLREGI